MIDYDKLRKLAGFDSYEHLKYNHKKWVESLLKTGNMGRNEKWTESIAVGSESFVYDIKIRLGANAQGRKARPDEEGYHLKEPLSMYKALFEAKKNDIGLKNTHLWNF